MTAQHDPAISPRPKQRITPRALLEAKRLSDPRIHPDGQRVAFVVTEADFDESLWISHLWLTEWLRPEEDAPEDTANEPQTKSGLPAESDAAPEIAPLNADTTGSARSAEGQEATDTQDEPDDPTRQLTFSRDGEHQPQWSPDGRYLAFLSARLDETEAVADDDEEPKEQVWILPIDGGEARCVTKAKEGVLDYVWLGDSDAGVIVYVAPEPRPGPVEAIRKEARDRRKVDPIVEQDDRLRRQFWRVDVEEKKPKLLFTGDYGVTEFAISPDATKICYGTNYSGDPNDYHLVDLFIRHLDDGTTYKLVARPGGKYNPRWSPDGRSIAFLTWLDPALSYSRESLFYARLPDAIPADYDGVSALAEAQLLTRPEFDYDLHQFEVTASGKIFALAAARTVSPLFCFTLRGTTLARLDADGERHDLTVDPGSDNCVYVQESATALPELFLRDAQGQEVQLTKLNSDFRDTYELPRQEVVTWTSGEGETALEIEGVLTYPRDFVEGTPAPLIVQIHGGPKGRSTNGLQNYNMAPVWAAEGYAVLRPNFRGSEGYGNAFAVANRRDLGGGDFQDIMAGVEWCVAKGIADPQRLGVMGGSYGGYMTNWAIGHTDRFKAAVSQFGIFHLQTDYSNSSLSRWDNDYLGAYYWEDPDIYRRLSPGSYIEAIKTPTLIIHGDDDDNTFISNSKELYQALRHRGVTTQFVHYPREGHGLREPNHRLDEIRRCLAWMDRYVRADGQNPTLYRIGDRVPAADGGMELCITKVEEATFLGQPAQGKENVVSENDVPATALLEVVLTLHSLTPPAAPFTLALTDLSLAPDVSSKNGSGEPANINTALTPIGAPLDVPGGKLLLEGDNLRVTQHPDTETKQIAFGLAAVFRVPKAGGMGKLRVGSFSPVEIAWSADEDDEEKSDTESK